MTTSAKPQKRIVYAFDPETGEKKRPFAWQTEFHRCDARFKGFSGPVGSGKSRALCTEALKLAYINVGRVGVIGAPTYPMLRDSTRASFIEVLEENEIHYRAHKSENSIYLPDVQSTVLFRALDSFERIRGTNLAWFGVDELTYCKAESWLRLEARLRDPKAKHLCGFGSWTPKGHDWVYQRFIGPKKLPGYQAFFALQATETKTKVKGINFSGYASFVKQQNETARQAITGVRKSQKVSSKTTTVEFAGMVWDE